MPRQPYDASAPFQLMRQLAAAAHQSDSFESRWMQTWAQVETALGALFYMAESSARLLGAPYKQDSRFSGDTDHLYKILRAASQDYQIGSDRVRGAMINAIGYHMNFIFRTANNGSYKAGFQEMAGTLKVLILSSDTSLLYAGREGMYCTFYIMLNFLQSRDPFEALAEAVLRSAKTHAQEVNDNADLALFWGQKAGGLAGTLQAVLLKVNKEDMEDANVISTWFSRIGTVASIFKGGAIASVVTLVGTEAIQEMEDASEEEQTNATRKAAGKIEEIITRIGQEVIEDIDQWKIYSNAISTGSKKARKLFGHHF